MMFKILSCLALLLTTHAHAFEVDDIIVDNSVNLLYATPNRVAILDSSSNLVPSSTTTTQLSFLDATSSIQAQLNSKQSALSFTDSITNSAGTVSLVNDSPAPGISKYYGTNNSGTLGYFTFPTGGVSWGGITGTLSNQTDLQSALNAKQNTLTIGNLTIPTNPNFSISGGTGAVIGSGTAFSLIGASIVESTSNVLTLTGATNAVLGTGVSIQVKQSGASQDGYLSSTNFNIFNAKQPAGSYLTTLTGDGTASGPGSSALVLATVNGNIGSFGSASSVSTFTANGKGLITAAGSTSIQIAESQVTNLTTDLAGRVPTTRTISTTTPLSGGGDLSTDLTLAIDDAAADGSTKGAAAFNSTNFTASAGVVNTIQDIATTSDMNFNSITINGGAGFASDGRLFTPEWNFPPGSTTTGPGVYFTQDGFASFIGNQIVFDTSETITGDHNPTINVASSTDNALVVSGGLYVANQFNAAHGGFTVDSDGNMYAAGQLVTNGDGVNVFSNMFIDANVYDGNQVALWTPSNRTFQDLNGQDALTVDDGSQNTVFAPAGITRVHSQNLDGPTFFIDAPSLNAGANAFQVSIDSTVSAAIDDQGNTSLASGQIQANADGSRFQLGNPASGVGIGYGGGQFFIQTTGSGLVIGDYEGSGNGTKMVFSDGVGVIEAIVPGQFVVTGPLHVTGTSTLVDANLSGTLNIAGLTPSTVVVTDGSNNISSSSITTTQLGLITAGKGSTSWALSTGSLTSIVANEIIGGGKTAQAMTIRNITAAAAGFTCVANPVLTLRDCGTSAGACTSGTTTIGTVTLTASNTLTAGSISSASIAAGHFWAWQVTSGTCTLLNATGSAEVGSALQ